VAATPADGLPLATDPESSNLAAAAAALVAFRIGQYSTLYKNLLSKLFFLVYNGHNTAKER